MNTDIRVLVSFKGHRKRIRLEKRIGPGAVGHLIDLWVTVALDRPEGVLDGWDETDIAIAAGWIGDSKDFVEALVDCRWLDFENGAYKVHDWDEHQGWACGAKKRSASASKNATVRWEKRDRARSADANKEQCGGNAGA